jgi:hypothetical protein
LAPVVLPLQIGVCLISLVAPQQDKSCFWMWQPACQIQDQQFFAPIAQLDRAADYGSAGYRFNSYWVHHIVLSGFSSQSDGVTPEVTTPREASVDGMKS